VITARQPGGAPNRCAVPRWARQQRHSPVNKNFGDRAQVCTLSPKFFARVALLPSAHLRLRPEIKTSSLITFLGPTKTVERSPFATRNQGPIRVQSGHAISVRKSTATLLAIGKAYSGPKETALMRQRSKQEKIARFRSKCRDPGAKI